MKPLVYLETSVISYLTARPSRDVITLAMQRTTHEWWRTARDKFDLVVSDLVLLEASAGDPRAAQLRLERTAAIRVALTTDASRRLTEAIMRETSLPKTAEADAAHIAIAATNRADYLMTWNLRHIAAAVHRRGIQSACGAAGLVAPTICTPGELFGG